MARAMKLDIKSKGIKRGVNLNDIVVPEALLRRIKTGFTMFDSAFGGDGFVPSTVHMITGEAGAGKSTLLRQLGNAITASGNVALYNPGEESLYQVKLSSERLKLKAGFVVGQETMVPDLLEYADEVLKASSGKQMFLLQDSLQTLDDGMYPNGATNSKTPTRVTEMLVEWAKRTNAIVLVIGQVGKDGVFQGENKIKHAMDGHAHMYFDQAKRSETYGERLMEVSKNRWGSAGKTYIYGMGKEGIYEKGELTLNPDMAE